MAIRFRVRAVMTASIPVRMHLLCHYTQSRRKNQAGTRNFSRQIFSVRSYNPLINLYKSIDKVLMLRYDKIMKSEEKR